MKESDLNPWDLYSEHKKFAEATRNLEKAWQEAMLIAPAKPSKERASLAEQHVAKVLERYRQVGAMDTEPRWVLKDRVRKHFGVDGGWL